MPYQSADIELVSSIYNTALDPDSWPEVLMRLALRLGAAGSFIFEEMVTPNGSHIATRLFSENYDSESVRDYLNRFNREEISDQARFAELSAQESSIELVSDVYLRPSLTELLNQPNTQFMMQLGLKHRAGALLNKDLFYVDRFSLQFSHDRGPITEAERTAANLFLPHVAKVIGLARPLEERCAMHGIFSKILDNADQGIAILGRRGAIQFQNNEFRRILEEHQFFSIAPDGTLQCLQDNMKQHYHDLIAGEDGHGQFGARARREALVYNLPGRDAALFIEICPLTDGKHVGKLDNGSRLITVIDTSKPVLCDLDRIQDFYTISNSEAEVLSLIADGMSNSDIADQRNRSPDTVKTQIKALMRKTNSRNRTDLIHMVRNLSSIVRYEAKMD